MHGLLENGIYRILIKLYQNKYLYEVNMKLNKVKAILSLSLSFVMVVTQVPVFASSTDSKYNEVSVIHSFKPKIIEMN